MIFFRFLVYLSLTIILLGCAGAKKSTSPSFSPEKYNTVAVLVDQGSYSRVIEDAFVIGLINKGYSVVSRRDVDHIVGEIQFQGSGLTQEDRVKLGKMLNVRCILIANLTNAYSETRDGSYTDGRGTYHASTYTVQHAGINARLLDVENGAVRWVSSHDSGGGLGDVIGFVSTSDLLSTVQGVATTVAESFPDRAQNGSRN